MVRCTKKFLTSPFRVPTIVIVQCSKTRRGRGHMTVSRHVSMRCFETAVLRKKYETLNFFFTNRGNDHVQRNRTFHGHQQGGLCECSQARGAVARKRRK